MEDFFLLRLHKQSLDELFRLRFNKRWRLPSLHSVTHSHQREQTGGGREGRIASDCAAADTSAAVWSQCLHIISRQLDVMHDEWIPECRGKMPRQSRPRPACILHENQTWGSGVVSPQEKMWKVKCYCNHIHGNVF